MTRSLKLSRRTLLRGTGAAVALPWLDAMSSRSAWAAETGKPPVRLAFFYVPNGVNMNDWRLGEPGELSELSPILKPLDPVKDKVNVLTGMAADHCNGKSASHEPAGGGYLVGRKCKHSEEPEVGGASVDQVIARQIGYQTPIDSLALGIDPGHRGDHGYSGTYMSHISWRDKQTPAALELNPKQLYDQLFRGKTPTAPDWNAPKPTEAAQKDDSVEASVLDLVRDETKSLQRQLGFNDRRKLEAYLDGLRSIERRIASADRDAHSHHQDSFADDAHVQGAHGSDSAAEIPTLIIPEGKGIPSVYADHVNLMLDIMTLAFQTDTTRIASFMFSYEKSGRSYPEIDAKGSHHSTSHHQSKEENLVQLTRINRHHMELFSRMIQRMAEIQEGDATLLDNVMLCYGSGISDGNKHNNDDLPLLIAGGGGGTIKGGRHLVYKDKTPLCNLYLEFLSRMGDHRESFGDSSGLLGNLQG
ncbi:DUF1552 domain-containing protein [Stieleria varia]|uniref:DUF1552 domain-containing protein n=1 Tax=Stieleria varia TaxID=2528005 RepID=A0A5C6B2Q4_9BACT|nr:DUF1552 domain-containing protein [Stieleria varia]TWU06107.1 hypothetical protein Pla52n_18270 [Stieleria varia]